MTFDTAGRLAVLYATGAIPQLRSDLNDDGDYDDAEENVVVGTSSSAPIAATESASGTLRVLTRQGVFLGPVR